MKKKTVSDPAGWEKKLTWEATKLFFLVKNYNFSIS